jgi:hypothetical protein
MSQFQELRGYGPRASIDWACVFDIPFEDGAGIISEIRDILVEQRWLCISILSSARKKPYSESSLGPSQSPSHRSQDENGNTVPA